MQQILKLSHTETTNINEVEYHTHRNLKIVFFFIMGVREFIPPLFLVWNMCYIILIISKNN